MITFENFELWFITGSQHLYGSETLKQVVSNSKKIASYLDISSNIPIKVKTKRTLTTPEEIQSICKSANASDTCVGLIIWMHTFSPAKMWINGLSILQKPMLHLHTQFNSHIPWDTIDMDYMNLNQSAHGGREFGFINMRLKTSRKVVVGYWKDPEVIEKIDVWARAAIGWADCQKMKIARIGDNMREVAVTEGNKVSAQIKFGYSVNGYGLGDIVEYVEAVSQSDIDHLIDIYLTEYNVAASLLENGNRHSELLEAAKIEIGLKSFLQNGGFTAFTDTFENLTGLGQLPGIAVQRIMAAVYGFAAEGDWKTAGLVRTMKVMAHGLNGGNSFMEDYTYHLDPDNMLVLGAHMLEICPSISAEKPQCEIHPLGIGGKNDPVRLIFNAAAGAALNASMIDTGSRFRLLMNTVEGMQVQQKLPQLPVARALWQPHPDLKTAATAWILAGGAHHTCYSQNLGKEHLEDFAEMAGIEYLTITEHTRLEYFKQTLRNNEVYYHFLNN